MNKLYKIIVIGESWHGSNCTGLARGFRELGHAVELIGTDSFFPKIDRSIYSRILCRMGIIFYKQQFNRYIKQQVTALKPNFVVIFKGNYIQPDTLERIREQNVWLVNFYPDVSFTVHKTVNTRTFNYYHHIFTSKSFGVKDMKEYLGLNNVSLLPHGFDPYVHRPLQNNNVTSRYNTDISFIGTWSPHKERVLSSLRGYVPNERMTIWGASWNVKKNSNIVTAITGNGILGDYYALAICSSKINLGLLSEKRGESSMGDQITSRTFHIPASGGFLLHERTDEVLEYYVEGKEIECFESNEELADKVRHYLKNEGERIKITKAGYERCIKENRLSQRAQVIVDKYEQERS